MKTFRTTLMFSGSLLLTTAPLMANVMTDWTAIASTTIVKNGGKAPAPLSSRRYARDYNEVKAIGAQNSATRMPEQSTIARFWYEFSGAAWCRIARAVAQSRAFNTWDTAPLLALVNLAMADGFIAGFETKYHFNFWWPVTAIRASSIVFRCFSFGVASPCSITLLHS